MVYIWLSTSSELPDIAVLHPFKVIVVVERAVGTEQLTAISHWLVESGCLYMMAWGVNCHSWIKALAQANLAAFEVTDTQGVPDDRLVITTSHEKDSLQDVFWFSRHTAMHPCAKLDNTVLLHLSEAERESQLTADYFNA
ncbi:MAG: DUF7684 family protein [Gammaproteobacteria bacterium]